jgi:hypothetical protein
MIASILDAGYIDGSCSDPYGFFLQVVDVGGVEGSTPIRVTSAGLDCDGTRLHITEDGSSWIVASLLSPDDFNLVLCC